jgi:hypothetical protein
MKNLLFFSLFFTGVISTNDDVWEPTNDYHLKCFNSIVLYSKNKEDFKDNQEIYAHYDFEKDKKDITFLREYFDSCSDLGDNCLKRDDLIVLDKVTKIFSKFEWERLISNRKLSNDKVHSFTKQFTWNIGTDTGGATKYTEGHPLGLFDPVYLDRENLTLGFKKSTYQCSLITAAEYISGKSALNEKRDSLNKELVEKRKNKLRI